MALRHCLALIAGAALGLLAGVFAAHYTPETTTAYAHTADASPLTESKVSQSSSAPVPVAAPTPFFPNPFGAYGPSTTHHATSGLVTGIVVNQYFEPIPGMFVKLDFGNPNIHNPSVGSNYEGRFWFEPVPPGNYRIVLRFGEVVLAETTITMPPEGNLNDVQLIVAGDPDRLIAGRVIDTNGKPVVDATVHGTAKNFVRPASTTTNEDGRFLLLDGRGFYDLSVRHPGFSSANVIARPGDKDVLITLRPLARIEGRVVDADTGRPITRFYARFYHNQIPDTPEKLHYPFLFENKDGTFRLDRIDAPDRSRAFGSPIDLIRPAGDTAPPAISHPGRPDAVERIETTNTPPNDLPPSVTGSVFATADGYGIAGASVEITPGETTRDVVIELHKSVRD